MKDIIYHAARNFGGSIFADWRFFVFAGNNFFRLGQIVLLAGK